MLNLPLYPPSNLPRVAFITGSARRIGATLITAFHQAGYNVIIHYHTSHTQALALSQTCNSLRRDSAKILQANLDNLAELESLAAQAMACFGRIDVLIHNASRFYPTQVGYITLSDWENLFRSNAKAPLFLTQLLIESLKNTQGCVISVLDIHANGRPFAGYTVYNMAKAAHQMMVQSLALELAPHIRVNGIAPGVNILPEQGSEQAMDKQTIKNITQSIPLARQGEPDDIAQTALFLANASYITGQILAVDGGRSLTLKGG